jgi:hypothetical protein
LYTERSLNWKGLLKNMRGGVRRNYTLHETIDTYEYSVYNDVNTINNSI